jgi:molecular chaperone HscA
LQDIDPDHVVAWGAALQAEGLSGLQGPLLMDVLALSLGIETMGGGVEVLLSRNTPLPAKHTQEFTTFRDGQEAILIHIVQGESEHVQGCRSLARFELSGLAPLQAGQARLEVCFTMDADGLLSVSAREKNQDIMKHLEIKPTHGLDLDTIIALLKVEGL